MAGSSGPTTELSAREGSARKQHSRPPRVAGIATVLPSLVLGMLAKGSTAPAGTLAQHFVLMQKDREFGPRSHPRGERVGLCAASGSVVLAP